MTLTVGGRELSKLLIAGFGLSGRAVAAFCAERGVPCVVSDRGPLSLEARAWLEAHGMAFEQNGHTERFLDSVDGIILSPGVPVDVPLVHQARRRGLAVRSEIDLAAEVLPTGVRTIAVTGTNGKSTTVSLIGAILAATGHRAIVAGNIGLPFISIVDRVAAGDTVVLELSSFQLEQSELFRSDVAVLLNLAPNHLDRHHTMEAYVASKQRIFARQRREDSAVLSLELRGHVDSGRGRVTYYDEFPAGLPQGADRLRATQRLDLLAAIAACRALYPGLETSAVSLTDLEDAFRLPHRQQEVGFIRGARAVDDSKSTSAAATVAALESVSGPVVLLLGGRSKKAGYDDLARRLRERPIRAVVVYGEARQELSGHLMAEGVPFLVAEGLRDATHLGVESLRPGDTLLLSPACSSFDEFSDFEERGRTFRGVLMGLPGFVAPNDKDV